MAVITTETRNGINWMHADDLRAYQRPDGLWHIQEITSLCTLTRDATTEQARLILSEA